MNNLTQQTSPFGSRSEKSHSTAQKRTVLEVEVNNHAGVMSHICSLFARRAFNVDGILCLPIKDGSQSRIWLMVNEDARLEQMIRQLAKLEDVKNVRQHAPDHQVFARLEEFFQ